MTEAKTPKKKKRPALGRGLNALITQTRDSWEPAGKDDVRNVPVEEIQPMSGQPRTKFNPEKVEELASSIRETGVLQPLLVREGEKGLELIAGERRWRAAMSAGLDTVPVIVRDVDDAEAYRLSLIENIQREDLNPVDVARAYKKLMGEFAYTQEELSRQIGKSRASVANHLRLLKLPRRILSKVEDGSVSFGHARTLLALKPGEIPPDLVSKVSGGRISVRQLESAVKRIIENKKGKAELKPEKSRSESLQAAFVSRQLEHKLGLKVRLNYKGGKGRVVISFKSLTELDGLLERLGLNSGKE